MKDETAVKFTFTSCCLISVLLGVVFSFWTDRSVDFWASYVAGHEVNIHYWISLLLSIFFSEIVLIGNIFTEIFRAAIGQ